MSQQPCLPVICTKRKRHDEVENTTSIAFDDVNEMNASDYLQRVAQEARNISDETLIASQQSSVARKALSLPIIDGSAASMQYLLSHHTQIAPPPTARQPHEKAWITQALRKFTLLRDYLTECLQNGVGGKEHRLLTAVPPMKDAAGWFEFCTGQQLESNEDEHESNHNTAWRESLPAQGYHSPSVQLLCQLDQVMIRRVLAHLVATLSPQQQSYLWLYALMARLETPVHGQDAATLRKLVVSVAARRANEQNHDTLAAMNMVLVVAGLYFGQASRSELFPANVGS